MLRAALLLLLIAALPARAEDIVAALSQDRVSISTSFDGSEILIFGAIKRDKPQPIGTEMAIVVTVQGPREDVTVRRKDRRFGIWVNVEAIEVTGAPSFYAVASSAPLRNALSPVSDARWRVTTPTALRGPTMMASVARSNPDAIEAMIRVRSASGAYITAENSVVLRDDTLFSTTVALPSDLTEGDYRTRIFLTRDGEVVDSYSTSIFVQKVGLERLIYTLAHERPLIYGLLSLAIAIAAGWGASAVFRWVRI